MKSILFFIIFFLSLTSCWGQIKPKQQVPLHFVVRVMPLFPGKFIGEKTTILKSDTIAFISTLTQKAGYSIGGVVRIGITKLISIETGINYTQRQFDLSISMPDSSIQDENDLTFIQYDIPLHGMIYIQLDQQLFMNSTLGANFTISPTSIGVVNQPVKKHEFRHFGIAPKNKLGFDLSASLGFEYRSKKDGYIYLGGTARVPVSDIFRLYGVYEYATSSFVRVMEAPVNGSFFGIELKYFFPNIKKKESKVQFKNGPIEQ